MATELAVQITAHDDLPDEAKLIDQGLGAANDAAAPLHEVRPLSCFARLSDRVIGGAVGRTWGECCELQQLWVEPDERRRGIGARLVRAFEQHAEQRGCRTFYLYTFSFQAPRLYRSLGYHVAHETRGFAPGVIKYAMVRRAGEPSQLHRAAHARAAEMQRRLPGPPSAQWPEGERFVRALAHGTMSVELYAPVGRDPQTPHEQDELYFILGGTGIFALGDARHPFAPGDAFFVPAGVDHRFEQFSQDFSTWVVFWGPKGGEPDE